MNVQEFKYMLLNQLLDKYENSSVYKGTNKVKVSILIAYTKKFLPKYFDENDHLAFEYINSATVELESQEFISIVWKDKTRRDIIAKVNLNLENLESVYGYIGRTPKSEYETFAKSLIRKYVGINPHYDRFLNEQLDLLSKKSLSKKYIDIENQEELKNILEGIEAILVLESETAIRQFSIRLYHDSKIFEKIASKVYRIMADYWDNIDALDQDEVLGTFNLTKNPGYVYFKGKGMISGNGSNMDISFIKGGIAINSQALKTINVDIENAKYIITVENLTSFVEYPEGEAFVIYLGGYLNGIRKKFLERLYDENPEKVFYHFGDIDLGGYQILEHMKRETGIPFVPYLMTVKELRENIEYLKPISESYRKLVIKAMTKDEMKDYKEIFEVILELNGTLEQEILEVND